MTILKTNTFQHTNGTTSFTIGTDGKLTWSTSSGTYIRTTPSSNVWQGTVSSTYRNTFSAKEIFSEVPNTAKVLHCSGTAFNSSRNDHCVHLFGGNSVHEVERVTATGSVSSFGQSWDPSDSTRRKGSWQFNHEGDGSNPCSYYGNSETGLISLNPGGTFDMILADGYSTGTHYIVLTCWGYWI